MTSKGCRSGEAVPMILEAAAKQVDSPMMSSDVEEETLELYCGAVKEGEAADATEKARRGHAAVNSCGGEVNSGAGKAGPVRSDGTAAGILTLCWGGCKKASSRARWNWRRKILLPRL